MEITSHAIYINSREIWLLFNSSLSAHKEPQIRNPDTSKQLTQVGLINFLFDAIFTRMSHKCEESHGHTQSLIIQTRKVDRRDKTLPLSLLTFDCFRIPALEQDGKMDHTQNHCTMRWTYLNMNLTKKRSRSSANYFFFADMQQTWVDPKSASNGIKDDDLKMSSCARWWREAVIDSSSVIKTPLL